MGKDCTTSSSPLCAFAHDVRDFHPARPRLGAIPVLPTTTTTRSLSTYPETPALLFTPPPSHIHASALHRRPCLGGYRSRCLRQVPDILFFSRRQRRAVVPGMITLSSSALDHAQSVTHESCGTGLSCGGRHRGEEILISDWTIGTDCMGGTQG